MRDQIESIVAAYIRPLVEADGGAVKVLDASRERVVLALSGACAGCPGRPFTVARLIEPALHRAFGEGVAVEIRSLADRA